MSYRDQLQVRQQARPRLSGESMLEEHDPEKPEHQESQTLGICPRLCTIDDNATEVLGTNTAQNDPRILLRRSKEGSKDVSTALPTPPIEVLPTRSEQEGEEMNISPTLPDLVFRKEEEEGEDGRKISPQSSPGLFTEKEEETQPYSPGLFVTPEPELEDETAVNPSRHVATQAEYDAFEQFLRGHKKDFINSWTQGTPFDLMLFMNKLRVQDLKEPLGTQQTLYQVKVQLLHLGRKREFFKMSLVPKSLVGRLPMNNYGRIVVNIRKGGW